MTDFLDALKTYWPGYGVYTYSTPKMVPEPLPAKIFKACGISYDIKDNFGGSLIGVDMKNVDATSALKMSLIEHFAKGGDYLLEPVVNGYGVVELIEVGKDEADLSDMYSKISTSNYMSYENVVKITGKKPRPIRRIGSGVTLTDPIKYGAKIWDTSYMATGCELKEMKKHATVTFKDPHKGYTSRDGVDCSVYEAEWPWERVIGWVYYLDPQFHKSVDAYNSSKINEEALKNNVKIFFKNQSSIPFLLSGYPGITGLPDPNMAEDYMPSLGDLKRRTFNIGLESEYASCFEDLSDEYSCSDGGLIIHIPSYIRYELIRNTWEDKLLNISKIYVIGQELHTCEVFPSNEAYKSQSSSVDASNWDLWIGLYDWTPRYINLDEGTDYAIARDPDGTMCVQFIDNSHIADVTTYGKNTNYKITSACPFYYYNVLTNKLEKGIQNKSGAGTIFPRSNRTGILVQQVWAQIDLDLPCLVVQDPFGKADVIAGNVIYQMAPIILRSEPAPEAIDGTLLDLTEVFRSQDADPTTTQNFEETNYEKIVASMDGKQILELNMSTLDSEETVSLSSRLKDILDHDRDKDINVSYVCGPSTNPVLGQRGPSGGIINSINYSYADNGAYTVSVTEGSYCVPGSMSGITGGYATKTVETLQQASGTIIQDYGNHMIYKVLVDGFGVVDEVVSGTAKILREGDRVSLTIYNVPVES